MLTEIFRVLTFDGDLVLAGSRMGEKLHLYADFSETFFLTWRILCRLRLDEGLD